MDGGGRGKIRRVPPGGGLAPPVAAGTPDADTFALRAARGTAHTRRHALPHPPPFPRHIVPCPPCRAPGPGGRAVCPHWRAPAPAESRGVFVPRFFHRVREEPEGHSGGARA